LHSFYVHVTIIIKVKSIFL